MGMTAKDRPPAEVPDFEGFSAQLGHSVEKAETGGEPVSLVLTDLDWFGRLNNELGQPAGDALLELLGARLREAFGSDGAVCRYGGDAFAVILPGVERETAFLRAEAVREFFANTHTLTLGNGDSVTADATISAGVASFPEDGARDSELIRKVNEALYRAKITGRNKVCLARAEKMVTKTSHYGQGQLEGLSRLAKREGVNEAALLREALDDLLRKYND